MNVEDFSYTIHVYKNGDLVKTFSCPTSLALPYIKRFVYEGSPFTVDFMNKDHVGETKKVTLAPLS
jgi:hypothetical protein